MASGQQVIPYFLGAIAFTFAFTYVVYRIALKYTRRPGIAALTYFVSVLAIWYLSMSVFAINTVLGSLEGIVLSLLPELEPMSFARNFIGVGLAAMEVVIPASGIAAIVVLMTRQSR